MGLIIGAIIVLTILLGGGAFVAYTAFYKVAPPNKLFVVSRNNKKPVAFSGEGRLINPITQRINVVNLEPVEVDIKIDKTTAIPTLDKIGLMIDAQAVIQVDDSEESLDEIYKNFLNKNIQEIKAFALGTLEGSTREVVGSMKLVDIMEDREGFAEKVAKTIANDMESLGLKLVTYKLQTFTDTADVINNLGIEETASISKNAKISKARAEREVEVEQAKNREEANRAATEADLEIAKQNNAVELKKAELLAQENKAKAQAELAYEIEKEAQRRELEVNSARADKEREELRIEVEKSRLMGERGNLAEIKLLEQQKEAEGIRQIAKAKAEAIRLEGQAEADREKAIGEAKAAAILAEAEALKEYEGAAVTKLALEALVSMSENVTKPLENIDSITIYGEGGSTKLVEDTTKTLSQISAGLGQTLGFDLTQIISSYLGAKTGASAGASAKGVSPVEPE